MRLVYRHCISPVSYTHLNRREGVGPRAQVRDGAQVFKRVSLFLQGILRRGFPGNRDIFRLELKRLLGLGGHLDYTGDSKRRANILFGNYVKICDCLAFKHDLDMFKVTAIVELYKSDRFRGADTPRPAGDRHGLVCKISPKQILSLIHI